MLDEPQRRLGGHRCRAAAGAGVLHPPPAAQRRITVKDLRDELRPILTTGRPQIKTLLAAETRRRVTHLFDHLQRHAPGRRTRRHERSDDVNVRMRVFPALGIAAVLRVRVLVMHAPDHRHPSGGEYLVDPGQGHALHGRFDPLGVETRLLRVDAPGEMSRLGVAVALELGQRGAAILAGRRDGGQIVLIGHHAPGVENRGDRFTGDALPGAIAQSHGAEQPVIAIFFAQTADIADHVADGIAGPREAGRLDENLLRAPRRTEGTRRGDARRHKVGPGLDHGFRAGCHSSALLGRASRRRPSLRSGTRDLRSLTKPPRSAVNLFT